MRATHSLKAAAFRVSKRNRSRNTSARTTEDLQGNDSFETCDLLREHSVDSAPLDTVTFPDRDNLPSVANLARIASWLNDIGEQDPVVVAEVL